MACSQRNHAQTARMLKCAAVALCSLAMGTGKRVRDELYIWWQLNGQKPEEGSALRVRNCRHVALCGKDLKSCGKASRGQIHAVHDICGERKGVSEPPSMQALYR